MLVILALVMFLAVTGLLAQWLGADTRPYADSAPERWVGAPR